MGQLQPGVLPGILVTCVLAVQGWLVRAPGGRHRPLWSDLGRARDGPALSGDESHSADGEDFDVARLKHSRRKSATTAGALTDQARVCLAAPPPSSATLSVPSTRATHDGWPVAAVPSLPGLGSELVAGLDRRSHSWFVERGTLHRNSTPFHVRSGGLVLRWTSVLENDCVRDDVSPGAIGPLLP
jgi:hypothetical protein